MNKLNQNTNFLKVIAIISMVIDHVGLVLLNDNIICRMIGRLAFPIFFFCTFIGYFKTKNLKKYIIRLFILFIVTQPIYYLTIQTISLNICICFIMELLILYSLDHKNYLLFMLIFSISIYLIFFNEYMIHILLLTPILFYTKNTKWLFSISYILFYLLIVYLGTPYIYLINILALPFMIFKTNVNLKINKYFFYIFYPSHFLIIYLVKLLFY